MADNLLLPITLDRLVDSNGVPYAGGKVYVYDAGTTDLKSVYSDDDLTSAAANPIIADGGGYLAARYIGTGAYKIVITDSDGVTIKTEDDLPGALDTSTFSNDEATPITPVISKTTNYTVQAADKGKVIVGDPTGGDISITLLSAVTAGDDFRITIKHIGTANSVTVNTTGGQTLDGASEFVLDDRYEAITCVSDGANWHISESGRLVADASVAALPMGYLYGLNIANNSSDADHDIDISAGECRDAGNSGNMALAAFTKRIDASWATGSGSGGMASAVSLSNDSTYHVFIVDKTGGEFDVGFDTSLTAANLLSDTGGTKYRRIGSVITDGSANIRAFRRLGDKYSLKTPVLSIASSIGTTVSAGNLTVPTGISVRAIVNAFANHDTNIGAIYLSCPDDTDMAPIAAAAPGEQVREATSTTNGASAQAEVDTNTSGQINIRAEVASTTVRIITLAWIDPRA